jgi:hypothetical protein
MYLGVYLGGVVNRMAEGYQPSAGASS